MNRRLDDRRPARANPSADANAAAPLPHGWEARPRFDGGWTLARSGRDRQAIAIRWATLALASVTGAVFLFGHSLLSLVGRGIEPFALVLMGTGIAAIFWLEHRGPAFRLSAGRIERRAGLGGRNLRVYEEPSILVTGTGDQGWALVLRHDHLPEILASGLQRDDAFALAAFISKHAGARVDLPGALERELAEGDGTDAADGLDVPDAPDHRTGSHG